MIDLSMSEMIILVMALRVLCEQELSPKDREIAELLNYKLRISYRGKKVRVILADE